jgi:hypothetical protein
VSNKTPQVRNRVDDLVRGVAADYRACRACVITRLAEDFIWDSFSHRTPAEN